MNKCLAACDCIPPTIIGQDAGDTGAEFDRVFLQELRDLRIFVNDKDTVDEHKRFVMYIHSKHGYRALAS